MLTESLGDYVLSFQKKIVPCVTGKFIPQTDAKKRVVSGFVSRVRITIYGNQKNGFQWLSGDRELAPPLLIANGTIAK